MSISCLHPLTVGIDAWHSPTTHNHHDTSQYRLTMPDALAAIIVRLQQGHFACVVRYPGEGLDRAATQGCMLVLSPRSVSVYLHSCSFRTQLLVECRSLQLPSSKGTSIRAKTRAEGKPRAAASDRRWAICDHYYHFLEVCASYPGAGVVTRE
eukprot:g36957.t1